VPQFIRQRGDFRVSECWDPMTGGRPLSLWMSAVQVFRGLPRLFMSRQVFLLSLLFADTMGMARAIM